MRRVVSAALVAGVFIFGYFDASNAQDYPKSPIRIINASSAGGASDVFMRSLAEELGPRIKQPLVIENRPGGSFNIATRACSDTEPDGYTFCVIPGEVFIYNPFLFKSLPFDPDKAVDPVMTLFFVPQVLAVRSDFRVETVDQLVSLSKAKPNTLSYSSPGVAQAAFMESYVKRQKGGDFVRVPFRGGGDAVNGILTGSTPVAFIGVSNLLSQLEAKTVVGLIVDGKERMKLLPDVPTVYETGFNGDMIQPFFALFAPPNTPAEYVDFMRKHVSDVLQDEKFKQRTIIERGLSPAAGGADELRRLILSGKSVAKRIVSEAGMTAQ